jgi:hypothetical protein
MAGGADRAQVAGMGLRLLLGAAWLVLGGPLRLAERAGSSPRRRRPGVIDALRGRACSRISARL